MSVTRPGQAHFWAIIELQSAVTGWQKEGIASQTGHWLAESRDSKPDKALDGSRPTDTYIFGANTVRVLRFTRGNNGSVPGHAGQMTSANMAESPTGV